MGKPPPLKTRTLCFVTDAELLSGKNSVDWVEGLVKGGVGLVQFRNKTCSDEAFVAEAMSLKKRLEPYQIPLVMNDRVEAALEVGAAGVHLGQGDAPYGAARRRLGDGAVIGLSVETLEQVERANDFDLQYLGVSSVFSTATKKDTRTIWGLDGLEKVRRHSRHHLMAIGGISVSNVRSVLDAGADSVAVVSALCNGSNPIDEAASFLAAMSERSSEP